MAARTRRKASARRGAGARQDTRRRAILRAAVEVFARKGYHGCRMSDVAREAGVAYGLVYHYFRSKDALLETVFRAGWSGFVERLRSAAAPDQPLDQAVRGMARVVFDAWRQDPRAVRVLILEIARSPGGRINRQGAFAEVILLARELFERGRARGELRQGVDPLLCAALLFGALEMGLTSFVLGMLDARDEGQMDRACQQVSDVFLHGVLAPRPEAR